MADAQVDDDINLKQPVIINRGHRKSVVEDVADSLLSVSRKNSSVKKEKKSLAQYMQELSRSVYNPEYREFLSRDAMGWLKLSFYYTCFYVWLTGFFLALLYVFWAVKINGSTAPVYYNEESVMNYKKVNPGMGFRPQSNPESSFIHVDTKNPDNNVKSLNQFLENYEANKDTTIVSNSQSVNFDYHKLIDGTPCSVENQFGFNSPSPCVAVKLNKIYNWKPLSVKVENLPAGLNETMKSLEAANAADKFVYISCAGVDSADRDNIKELAYYSSLGNAKIGGLDFKYFPYLNQQNYLSPLVFVHFKDVSVNTLLNIECKAYADNIDNQDRLNQRGMVKFEIFIKV